ncbi:L-threonate dehydrogenase [Oceanibium sediminis]|uniref:L-threonate dehydrogenase n=1 Tax=Oceanibium sediminis TaxID=2026339 RepID=UPI000DD4D893|nr:L-threonate dehydrogenase [Oceanibium sediminis]
MTEPKCTTVAFLGLGSMGYGMAQSAIREGLDCYCRDIRPEPLERILAEGAKGALTPEALAEADVAVVTVLNAAQTEAVLFGEDGIVRHMRKGAVVVCCVTMDPDVARQMESRCQDAGLLFIDAPISGGSIKAAQGTLSILASGRPEAFDAARPVLDAMAETVFELGESAGTASAMKAVNQLLCGVHISALGEAVTFAATQGIPAAQFLNVISKCAGSSWMLENRGPHIVDGDYTPHSAVNIWLKDLGIAQELAGKAGAPTPLMSVALEQFKAAADAGLGLEDDAAVAKVYAKAAGVSLPESAA